MLFPDFTVNKPPLKHLPKKTFFIRFLFMCIIRQNFLNFNLLKALVDTFFYLSCRSLFSLYKNLQKGKCRKRENVFESSFLICIDEMQYLYEKFYIKIGIVKNKLLYTKKSFINFNVVTL